MKDQQESYENELKAEFQRKIEILHQDMDRSKECARSNLSKKLQEFEKKKQEELISKMNTDITSKYSIWKKEKILIDEKFLMDKKNLEEQSQKEFQNFKESYVMKKSEEIGELESQKNELLKKINDLNSLSFIDNLSHLRLSNSGINDIRNEFQNKIKQLNEEIVNNVFNQRLDN